MDPELAVEKLGPAQRRTLREFEALLSGVALPRGLIGPADAGRIHERHVLDSLRAVHCLRPHDVEVADLGSGAGLPGIPLAIARPDCRVTLVESQSRRVAFLELAVDELGLANVRVDHERAETAGLSVDVVVSRALASARRSWELARPNLGTGGSLLYFAGRSWSTGDGASAPEVSYEICISGSFPWQGPIVRMRERPPSA
jgi:16S rRNA (guanine527-N7)-methyltransferase